MKKFRRVKLKFDTFKSISSATNQQENKAGNDRRDEDFPIASRNELGFDTPITFFSFASRTNFDLLKGFFSRYASNS